MDNNNNNNNNIHQSKEIKLGIHLNEKNMPISLDWDASDSPIKGAKPCKAFMLRTWDAQNQQTTHIDIWEQDFNVDEMNHFMFQTIATLSDTYQRATSNNDLANEMREFAYKFAQKNGIKFNR